uniref:EB1 C-terminal domain-containing protein n=1 Tax=Romanomermis culicivorax TaxID=13658 RepID=A0A915INZ3_ROMCU
MEHLTEVAPIVNKSSPSQVATKSTAQHQNNGNGAAPFPKGPASKAGSSISGSSSKLSNQRQPDANILQLQNQINELTERNKEYETVVESLEKERDFYFGKLRQIEISAQENEENEKIEIAKILEILYATEEGFAAPESTEAENGANEEY